ncbi:hypothetical protein [Candidatus Tisiphia endosymbiont of Oplodontha viridula]|uniref:hypothetical protein n=1 Tax=Candidatus Tisiphia endosymbiont of Oplodontha viridula TaxID=3077925 RepID=UPI0035C8BA12
MAFKSHMGNSLSSLRGVYKHDEANLNKVDCHDHSRGLAMTPEFITRHCEKA